MPSANIKNVPRRVNIDDDIRVLENYDLTYANNIRIMSSAEKDAGAVESVKGNTEIVVDNFPSGTNRAIGYVKHQEKNDLYIFFYNSNYDHCIVRYNSITNIARIVLKNSLLKFSKEAFVNGFAVTGNNENETLLFWTDNINQPRQINVKRAERHTDGDYVNGYANPLTEQTIRWIKYPPLNKPEIQHGQDDTIVYNNIATKVFQFRYRYIYKDGQQSAYSPISDISVSDEQLLNSSTTTSLDLTFNYINVTVKNANEDVKEIEVVVREGNTGAWLLFKTLQNNTLSATQSVRFYNDDTYRTTDLFDTLKNYDAVPLKARTAEFVGSRAIIGNAVDGYDNIDQNELNDKITFGAWHRNNVSEDVYNVSASASSDNDIVSLNSTRFIVATFDTDFLPSVTYIGKNTTIYLSVKTENKYIQILNGKGDTDYILWDYIWTGGENDNFSDFVSSLAAAFVGKKKKADYHEVTCSSVQIGSGGDLEIGFEYTTDNKIGTKQSFTAVDMKMTVLNTGGQGSSFKAGAKHPLAIAYYDEAGRHGGAQKPLNNAPYVKWFSERDFYEKGSSQIDWRIGTTPPIWAKSFQILYGGNSSVGNFIQYTIAGAYKDKNSPTITGNKNIYLCLNNFNGDETTHLDSYITSKNPLINYQYSEGDRIRIIKPAGQSIGGLTFDNDYHDFKVIGYEYFPKSSSGNPYYSGDGTANENITYGWTLIVENPEVDGYSWDDINSTPDDNGWQYKLPDDSYITAFIEIYNSNSKNTEDVFYEIGEEYDILDAGTSNRRHAGTRNQGANLISPKTIEDISANPSYIEINYGKIPPNIFVGDVIRFTNVNANTPSGEIRVLRRSFNEDTGFWRFYCDGDFSSATISDVSTVDLNPSYLYAAGTLRYGDVWHKPRILVTGISGNRNVLYEAVEDYYANDFFPSNYWNKGRVHLYSPNAKQQRRKATVWISEQIFPEDNTNGLSAFNLSNDDLPFKDYDRSFGSIQLLIRRNDELIMYQENKVSQIPVGKDSIRTGDNQTIITLTSAVLGDQITYSGDYGICENPESFAEQDGRHYFVDIKRGKALRLSQDGLTPISDYKYSSFFDDASRDYMSVINSSNLKIYGGFDREYGEYNITFEQVDTYQLSVEISEVVTDAPFLTGKVNFDDPNFVLISIGKIEVADNVKTLVSSELFGNTVPSPSYTLEEVTTSGVVTLTQDMYEEVIQEGTLTTAVEIEGAVLKGSIKLEDSIMVIPTTNGASDEISLSATLENTIQPKTIVFHEATNSWIGERGYIPEGYGSVGYKFFTFKDGLWIQNQSDKYNYFYNSQQKSVLTPVLKLAPYQVCVLRSLSLEGNSPMNTFINSELNGTSFTQSRYQELEGMWYADVPMSETTTNSKNANVVGIGIVTSQPSSTQKTFSNDLAGIGLMVGDILFNNTGTANLGAITNINYETNTITHATPQGANNNVDFLYAVKDAKTNGEPIRGFAFEVRLENTVGNEFFELFAVNAHVAISNLNIGK